MRYIIGTKLDLLTPRRKGNTAGSVFANQQSLIPRCPLLPKGIWKITNIKVKPNSSPQMLYTFVDEISNHDIIIEFDDVQEADNFIEKYI